MRFINTLAAILMMACCWTIVACQRSEEPGPPPAPVAPAAENTYYDYTYYPDSEVYFYPPEGVYYWRDHDAWSHGRDLPAQFHLEHERTVPLHLHTARPYEMHEQIRRDNPGTHRP